MSTNGIHKAAPVEGSSEEGDQVGPLPDMHKQPSSPHSPRSKKEARFSVNNVNDQDDAKQIGASANKDEFQQQLPVSHKRQEKHARFSVANINNSNENDSEADQDEDGRDGGIHAATPPQSQTPELVGSPHECNNDDSHQKTQGSHTTMSNMTYNTQYFKSLRYYLTRDALPNESHYRNLLSISEGNVRKFSRPTMDELHEDEEKGKLLRKRNNVEIVRKDPEAGKKSEEPAAKGKVIKFGWIEGVYMRCLLNIWGVMLFLRLTWVVGEAGAIQGLLVITLANVVTVITSISMSAVCTNGQIKGGGIYYMISRSLGPEFGGAIGIMFTIANSIAVSLYIIGFCDSFYDMLGEYVVGFNGILSEARLNDIRFVGIIVLFAVLGLAVVGMDWVTRVQIFLLGLLVVSQLDFIFGSFFIGEDEHKFGIVGYNATVFANNLHSNYFDYDFGKSNQDEGNKPSFFSLFGVFFPAVTGIVAGANLSGDLKDPGTAIPKGTLLAIATTYVTYIAYGLMVAATTVPAASGIEEEYQQWLYGNQSASVLSMTDCETRLDANMTGCMYGSAIDQQCMAKISGTGFLIFAGCFAATLSSAIASLVGAPRVLQALAKDKLYPFVGFFAPGYGANNDPFRGYVLVFFISAGCILIGQLDLVSTLLSNFFVAAYALINFSVFHASITKSPGWRPSFKYYSQWISLLGAVLCLAVMFFIDWITALVTFACVGVLYLYISYRKPEANWGSSTQAQQFVMALKNLQTLNEVPDHVKNYRPKVLVFSGVPAHRQPLVDFANLVTKKMSLLICSHIETQETNRSYFDNLKKNVTLWLKDHNIKAFFSTSHNKNFADGAIACINLVGLGKLAPNMVLLGFKSDWHEDPDGLTDYINVIHHGFDVHMSMGILRLAKGCDFSDVIGREEQIIIGNEDAGKKATNGTAEEISESGLDDQSIVKTSNVVVEKAAGRKMSMALYHGVDGTPLSKDVVADITQFQAKKRKGAIDVWWLYDDGGLTLLLPYILTMRSQFSECGLRVFTLANKRDQLDQETRNMISLLAKFRIDYSDVTVIPDVTKKAKEETKIEFTELLNKISDKPSEAEMAANREKTNRHLRLSELLREHSTKSEMVIMTLPMPRRGSTPPALYMSWLEMMTRHMPPFVLLRGNQTSVLTFYS